MNKSSRSETFGEQMAQAMAELRAIMASGGSPTGDGRLTIRTIQVAEPSAYDARKVRKVRAALNVSQAVFARLVGVSDVLEHPYFRYSARSALVRLRPVPSIGTVCGLPTGGMDAIAVVSRFA